MKFKQKVLTIVVASVMGVFLASPLTLAAAGDKCGNVELKAGQNCVNGVATSVINVTCGSGDKVEDSCIWSLLIMAINILTAGIGLVAVGGIVYGGILYASAGGNSENTKKGIKTIQNVVIGIVAYAVMYAFLNFIVPGGMFS